MYTHKHSHSLSLASLSLLLFSLRIFPVMVPLTSSVNFPCWLHGGRVCLSRTAKLLAWAPDESATLCFICITTVDLIWCRFDSMTVRLLNRQTWQYWTNWTAYFQQTTALKAFADKKDVFCLSTDQGLRNWRGQGTIGPGTFPSSYIFKSQITVSLQMPLYCNTYARRRINHSRPLYKIWMTRSPTTRVQLSLHVSLALNSMYANQM